MNKRYDGKRQNLIKSQGTKCPMCNLRLKVTDEIHVHHVNKDHSDNRWRNLQVYIEPATRYITGYKVIELHINQEPCALETRMHSFELEARSGDIPVDYNCLRNTRI
jgi:hypothetical protein